MHRCATYRSSNHATARMDDVRAWLSQARLHIDSAGRLYEAGQSEGSIDVEMIIDASHTAVRKSITAHMNFSGCKLITGVPNHHQLTIDYGRARIAEVPEDLWRRVNALRKARNDGDYANPSRYRLTPRDASDAIDVATSTVQLITQAIRRADREQGPASPRRPSR